MLDMTIKLETLGRQCLHQRTRTEQKRISSPRRSVTYVRKRRKEKNRDQKKDKWYTGTTNSPITTRQQWVFNYRKVGKANLAVASPPSNVWLRFRESDQDEKGCLFTRHRSLGFFSSRFGVYIQAIRGPPPLWWSCEVRPIPMSCIVLA